MAMKRCDQGHYYDADKHTMCPACTETKGSIHNA
jgi:RNA polymerase subunit RPABC4/transcription elongation factor Spt4